ncbi:MAG: DUF411 domain-containing protein [Gammaproteobacteria bacterium]|jgi:hypothetical protein|nr:DUF411 domain-containing protein [Gammaproteobacteria bacterium]MDP6616624.1 DUF411 domain-containing protein [Gammaproteobacteria bacterium]MDP6694821.1 DUF411 domain-containing protein [Gammaproteobacteria bacterium]MDP7041730.1 DUF411 domain-containing protein [Gammaproteobacteria bacterium]
MIGRRKLLRQLALILGTTPIIGIAETGAGPHVQVYKSRTCGCCNKWIDHLRAAGFAVEASNVEDVDVYKREHGVPVQLSACHTALVDGYVVEGHVPAEDVIRMLRQKPDIAGIAVPGMPLGSPGMEVPNPVRYETLSFDRDGNTEVFAVHEPD